jgi:hypothetical protein
MKNGVFWVVTRATRRNNPEDTILHKAVLVNRPWRPIGLQDVSLDNRLRDGGEVITLTH